MARSDYSDILGRFRDGRVAVLGDVMLDVYLWGRVNRISPEAPVPVINIDRRSSCLGGAANVMRNLATLGARASAYGAVGDDPAAAEVCRAFDELGIAAGGVLRDSRRRTTEKRRVIAGGQQLLREDFEDTFALSDEDRRRLVDGILAEIRSGRIDAVIFEDYAKGTLAPWMLDEIIPAARRHGVRTALDPKPGNLTPVKHLTVMKPNRSEAFAMAGLHDPGSVADPTRDAPLAEVARRLFDAWEPECLLISLAAQGLALYRPDHEVKIIPTMAREVFDVSGAGDTVTATFTLAMISGATPETAAEIANLAAGVVVGKVGTAPIDFNELERVCRAGEVS